MQGADVFAELQRNTTETSYSNLPLSLWVTDGGFGDCLWKMAEHCFPLRPKKVISDEAT